MFLFNLLKAFYKFQKPLFFLPVLPYNQSILSKTSSNSKTLLNPSLNLATFSPKPLEHVCDYLLELFLTFQNAYFFPEKGTYPINKYDQWQNDLNLLNKIATIFHEIDGIIFFVKRNIFWKSFPKNSQLHIGIAN